MTEEEKKAIEQLHGCVDFWKEQLKKPYISEVDTEIAYKEIKHDKILLNLIQKQDTEINKLNNVIDKLVEELRYEVGMGQDSIFCNDICNHYKENCKEEKCRKCIKEYFMKEDFIGK